MKRFLVGWGVKVHKQEHYNQHRLLFSKLHPGYHKIIHPLPSQEDKQMKGGGEDFVWICEYNIDRNI